MVSISRLEFDQLNQVSDRVYPEHGSKLSEGSFCLSENILSNLDEYL